MEIPPKAPPVHETPPEADFEGSVGARIHELEAAIRELKETIWLAREFLENEIIIHGVECCCPGCLAHNVLNLVQL
jgi:hypothetical protein